MAAANNIGKSMMATPLPAFQQSGSSIMSESQYSKNLRTKYQKYILNIGIHCYHQTNECTYYAHCTCWIHFLCLCNPVLSRY